MKITALLLALAMLLSLAACTADPVDPVESDTSSDSTSAEDTTTNDPMAIQTGDATYDVAEFLPAEKFDGEDIHVWINGADNLYNIQEEDLVEGDIVQEALRDRNAAVENTFGVILNYNRDWKTFRDMAGFRQSVLAGDEYDLVSGPARYMNPHLVFGCYTDMADNEYIDFNQPWWIPEATANQRVYDSQYTAVGYFDFPTITRIQVYYFSDPLVIDFRLGNLYDLVNNGEWTWDKMTEMCEIVAEDLNQDGVMDASDRFGLSGRWDFWASETATAGYQYISRDGDGEYVITGINDDLLELSDNIYPVITNADFYFSRYTYGVHPSFPSDIDAEGKSMFTNNRILFMLEQLTWTGNWKLRDYGAYGILPAPKYLEDQEGYGTASTAYVSAICSTTGDLKISSVILEALQIESYNILRPAYINEALSFKYLSDPQAVDMLNLIFRNVATDFSYNFSLAGLGDTLFNALPTQQYLGSYFQTNASAITQKLNDFVESVNNMQ